MSVYHQICICLYNCLFMYIHTCVNGYSCPGDDYTNTLQGMIELDHIKKTQDACFTITTFTACSHSPLVSSAACAAAQSHPDDADDDD